MNERLSAFHILVKFEKSFGRLDVIEAGELSGTNLESNQRRHLKNLTSGVLRHLTLLDWYASKLYKGSFPKMLTKIKIILRMGLYEIIFMDHIPDHASVNEFVNLAKKRVNDRAGKLVNAILRSFLRQKNSLEKEKSTIQKSDISTIQSFPKWLVKRWIGYWGKAFTQELCKSINELPTFDIRVNLQKINLEKFKELLIANDIEFKQSKRFNTYFKIKQIGRIREAELFEKGFCSVQDESAAIPPKMLQLTENDTFLDVCAAPGGKYTQVLENRPDIKLAVAMDSDLKRLRIVKANIDRLGLSGNLVVADARNLPFKLKFKKILIDAPCSGQGVIGKHPDIKWRRTEKEVTEFSLLQKDILESVSTILEEDGLLVYSTCSIDKNENQRVVESILNTPNINLQIKNADTDQVENIEDLIDHKFICTYPNMHGMDGSFSAILKRD